MSSGLWKKAESTNKEFMFPRFCEMIVWGRERERERENNRGSAEFNKSILCSMICGRNCERKNKTKQNPSQRLFLWFTS